MRPPFEVTPEILNLCIKISRILGQYEGIHVSKPEPKLRRSNRIRTLQASLAIEGNTLQLDQVTAILDGKRVLGSQREIMEVENANRAYELISSYKPFSSNSLRQAHGVLMAGLIKDAGKWRTTNVGVFQGSKIAHAAPQAKRVPELMDQLFAFAKSERQIHPLILSAIFHYELEFIHPFTDGNGRIGRLWQTTLLKQIHPVFEFTPVESVIKERQVEYYQSLGLSDKTGSATPFIEFSLSTICEALKSLQSEMRREPMTTENRFAVAQEKFGKTNFSRKDYLAIFKTLSTATASRDLALAAEKRILIKSGSRARTRYRFS